MDIDQREQTDSSEGPRPEATDELAIQTEHLTKIYGQRLIAVNDMNLAVPKGSVFGLLGATSQRIGTFSTGMCTRLGIAASLVADPPLLIGDEPTAGLDPSARRFTLDLIHELSKTKTIVIATHILGDIDQICQCGKDILKLRLPHLILC